MTADEALYIAQAAAEADELFISDHAQARGAQRQATAADIREAILTADVAAPSEDGPNRWLLVGGCDLDGCGLRIVVAIDKDECVTVTVVTVFPT